MNTIINFHDVYDQIWFEQTLILLKNNYKMIGIEDVESFYYDNKDLKQACHITVDDGDRTFYEVMYPLLKKHKVPASLFVSPKVILNTENFWFQEIESFDKKKLKKTISQYFNYELKLLQNYPAVTILKNFKLTDIWGIISLYKKENNIDKSEFYNINLAQLLEIDKNGLIAIGAHTQNHPILANETDGKSQFEIQDSIENLEQILGHKIRYFAYPNGVPKLDFGEREKRFLNQKGVKLSFTTEINNFKKSDNPLTIPRIGITYGSKNFLRAKLFLGKYWEVFKKIKSTEESAKRFSLKEKLNPYNIQK